MDQKVTLVSGQQLWVLVPSRPSRRPDLFCSKDCSVKDITGFQWFKKLLPQLKDIKVHGNKIVHTILTPGDTLYIPHEWAAIYYNVEESIIIRDMELNSESMEEAAISLSGWDTNQMKKFLYDREDLRRERRRFEGTIGQVGKIKAKLNSNKKK